MRIAVCDDETAVLKLVSVFIRTEFENRREPVTVSSYTSAVRLISDLETKQFDAVFLDIRMPEMDGFRAAEELRKNAPEAKIIFITTEDDLVYDSFDFQPFAFIPKTPPELMKSRLSRTVDNLLAACNAVRKICIELPYNDKIYLRPDELIYVNSEKNDNVYYEWVGKVLEIVPEYPEGFFYKLELDEQGKQIANTSYLLIWYECVLGLA